MKLLTVPPDAEHLAIDYLTTALAALGEDVTVGVNIPATWTPATKSHVQVMLIGTPEVEYPILARASVGVTCWNSSTTTAKALAALCMGLLCSHPGGAGVASIRPLTGVLPTKDPDSGAQLAAISVRLNLRMTVPA